MSVVYFIQAGAGGPIKIGVATDIARRVATLQTGSPEPLVVLATIAGGRAVEGRFHRALSLHRLRSEWFNPTPEVAQAVDLARRGELPTAAADGSIGALVDRFGGLTEFAQAIGVPLTTAAAWRDVNHVPRYRHLEVIRTAQKAGVEISTADFPSKEQRIARAKTAA